MTDEIEHDKPDAITRLRGENERLRATLRMSEEELERLHGNACTCTVCDTIRATLRCKNV